MVRKRRDEMLCSVLEKAIDTFQDSVLLMDCFLDIKTIER